MSAVRTAAAAALTIAIAAPAFAHAPPDVTMTVGTLTVEKYGAGTPALILVPGLACGSWVWDNQIDAFAGTHAIYAVTVAGFSGAKPIAGGAPVLDGIDASLQQLITQEKLEKPVLIGHSLGGFMAIRFAEEHAGELSAAIAVDGLPVFPTLALSTPEERKKQADKISQPIRGQSAVQFAQYQIEFISAMVTDPGKANSVAKRTGTSDPDTVASALDEMLKSDLRSDLGKLTIPFLEIAPTSADSPYTSQQTVAFYTMLMTGALHASIEPIANSRHFAMLDQPDAFNKVVEGFLSTLTTRP